ncbi:MAG TPA: hypothetical protein VKB95_07335 [Chitinophagaceae bacterium]|nr:hypothetical protein [Chitinophagaceae bacterium]
MRPCIIILSLLVCSNSYTQTFEIFNGDTVNKIDKRGLKQGKWIEFPTATGRCETYFVNGKENGVYHCYDDNNWLSQQGFYKNGKEEGKTSEFENGKLSCTYIYRHDKIASQIIEYYQNGQPKKGGNYFAGNGDLVEYDSSGFVISKKTYKGFKLNGQFEDYFRNGHLKGKGIYIDNKYWTIFKRFDSLGNKIDFGTIKSGNGSVYCYNDSGGLIKSEQYKNGKLWNIFKYIIHPSEYGYFDDFKNGNGILHEFDSKGTLISELTYRNGSLNGTCKYIYGDIFVIGRCINDNKEGQWLRYSSGKIQNILYYKADRQIGIACF